MFRAVIKVAATIISLLILAFVTAILTVMLQLGGE